MKILLPRKHGSISKHHLSQMISLHKCAILVFFLDYAYIIVWKMCNAAQISPPGRDERKEILMNTDQNLYEVARLYYEQNMTQEEIAKRLFISRSGISRLIKTSA